MRNISLALLARTPGLAGGEQGQDLVEYALIVALISLASIVGMQTLAGDINSAFNTVGSQLSVAV